MLVNTGPDEEPFTLPGAPYATSYRALLDTSDEQPGRPARDARRSSTVVLTPHSVQVHASHALGQRRSPLSIPALDAGRTASPSSAGSASSRCRGTMRVV